MVPISFPRLLAHENPFYHTHDDPMVHGRILCAHDLKKRELMRTQLFADPDEGGFLSKGEFEAGIETLHTERGVHEELKSQFRTNALFEPPEALRSALSTRDDKVNVRAIISRAIHSVARDTLRANADIRLESKGHV